VIVILVLLLSVGSASASSVGGSCRKAGQLSGTSKKPLVCSKVAGKFKWVLGNQKPGALFTATTANFYTSLGISLKWSFPVSQGSSPITSYRIEFQRADTPWLFASLISANIYTTNIKADELAGANYRFRVAAVNDAGIGVYSESNWVQYTTTTGTGASSITIPSSNASPNTTAVVGTTTSTVALVGTVSQRNAVLKAASYLRSSSFSRSGLISQLQYEGFSLDESTYGVDAQNADWNAQAVLKAASYLRSSSFSRTGLINQMVYEGFSSSQSVYGVDAQNADWNTQAAKKAASYLQSMSFSRSGLISQLMYDGFSQAQAEYGVSTTGL
jgi:hypothetical protein